MMPENLMLSTSKYLRNNPSRKEECFQLLYQKYHLINDLYIYIAANQRIRVISGHDIVMERKVNTQEEIENRIYPCIQ